MKINIEVEIGPDEAELAMELLNVLRCVSVRAKAAGKTNTQ